MTDPSDDFVVLARYISAQLQRSIEGKLEGWLGLQINRAKTRTLDLRQPGQSLDFLGYTFRYDRDRLGRNKRYWNLMPSRQALARERAVLHEKLGLNRCHLPLPDLISELNRHLRGWAKYFSLGCPRQALRDINAYVYADWRNTSSGAVNGAGSDPPMNRITTTLLDWGW